MKHASPYCFKICDNVLAIGVAPSLPLIMYWFTTGICRKLKGIFFRNLHHSDSVFTPGIPLASCDASLSLTRGGGSKVEFVPGMIYQGLDTWNAARLFVSLLRKLDVIALQVLRQRDEEASSIPRVQTLINHSW